MIEPIQSGESRESWVGYLASQARLLISSPLGRRIVLIVFVSILVVEAAILIPSYENREKDLLLELENIGLTAVRVSFGTNGELDPQALGDRAELLLGEDHLRGVAFYDAQGNLIEGFGESPLLSPALRGQQSIARLRHDEGRSYDVLWHPARTGLPVTVVARLDASWIDQELNAFVWRVVGLVLLISVFVMAATLLALGHFILRPLLDLRSRLVAAQRDPANADQYRMNWARKDEVGEMVAALNELQNRVALSYRGELQESRNRLKDFADAASDWFWEMDENLRFSYFSDRFTKVTGVPPEALLGKTRQETGIPNVDQDTWRRHLADLAAHKPFRNFIHPRTKPDGTLVWLSINGRPVFDPDGRFKGYRGTGSDVTERRRAEEVVRGRAKMLESLAAGAPLEELFSILIATMELIDPETRYAVLQLDEENQLRFCAAPNMPVRLKSAIEGLGVGPGAGSSGTAAYTGERVIVEDVATHPFWAELGEVAEDLGVCGSWAEPIKSISGDILGTVEVCICKSRPAQARELDLLRSTAQLAGLVIERKQAESALLEAKELAENASKLKSKFLAIVSHELRTPLNAIIGFSEVINSETMGPVGSTKYREYAKDINDSGQHLLELINDILDLSKIEAGTEELNEETISISELSDSVIRLLRQRAHQWGIDLELKIDDDLPLMRADLRKLKQVFVNLLSNALKFTEPGGSVEFKVTWHDEEGFVFQVRDTGIGIAAKNLQKALTAFEQVEGPFKRRHQGTGLGLPLSKSLVELHGGTLELESQLGVGTVITIRLPTALALWEEKGTPVQETRFRSAV